MDVNWVRDYLLARHPLAAQVPVALALTLLFWTWRAARERLRARGTVAWCVGVAAVAGALMLTMAFVYVPTYNFLDHVEPNVVGIAQMFASGRPIYHAPDAAERYALLYGPNLFILYGALLKLSGSSVPLLKAAVVVGFVATLIVAWLAYRREAGTTTTTMAWAALAYLVVGIASYADLPLWVRAEPALMLLTAAALLAALTMGPTSGAIAIGLIAGLVVNVKAHAPLYLVTAWMLFPYRWRIASLLIAAVTTGVVAALPFLIFREEASIELYLTWLRAAGKHGIKLSFLARNVEVLIYLAAPAAALALLTAWTRPQQFRQWLLRDRMFVVGLAGSAALVVVAASKPGAGPWHLMPLLIPFGYAIACLGTILAEPVGDERSGQRFFVAASQGVIASFVVVAIAAVGSQLPDVLGKLNLAEDRAIVGELRQIVATHPNVRVYLGVGGNSPRLDYYRPVLLGLGQPYLLDYAAVMDMKLSGMPLPESTRRAVRDDPTAVWLFPKGSRPFSISSVYHTDQAVFDDEFQRDFEARFHPTVTSMYFDLWTAKSTGPSAPGLARPARQTH